MDGLGYKDYFLQPAGGWQRRYEALRCVLVEEQPMKQVAKHFQVSYGTIRNWVSEFCRGLDAGQSPPFSPRPHADALPPTMAIAMSLKFKSPTCEHCRWKRDAA